MGLGFLGRGRVSKLLPVGLVHVCGAILGGMAIGGLLGGLGAALALSAWRPWIIGVMTLWAFILSIRQRPMGFRWQRQVPRWDRTMPPYPRYLLWGVLLGCGLVTPTVSAALLVLLSAQLTAGATLGALAGAIFGGTREAMALLPPLRRSEPATAMSLLPRFATAARRGNVLVVLLGGIVLVLAS